MTRIALLSLLKDRLKWKMEPDILDSLIMVCATEKENRFGKTIHYTRGIGWMIELTVEEG